MNLKLILKEINLNKFSNGWRISFQEATLLLDRIKLSVSLESHSMMHRSQYRSICRLEKMVIEWSLNMQGAVSFQKISSYHSIIFTSISKLMWNSFDTFGILIYLYRHDTILSLRKEESNLQHLSFLE